MPFLSEELDIEDEEDSEGGFPRRFPMALDVNYPPGPYDPKSPYASRLFRTVATVLVAADGSGDFADLHEAYNSLPAGGGVIHIKDGEFTLDSEVEIDKNNVSIVGVGKATKIITSGNFAAFGSHGYSGITIENLYLYGAGTGNGNSGIIFIEAANCRISQCWIENFGVDGITCITTASNGLTITNCNINANVGGGILGFGSSLLITNNVIDSNGEAGIYLSISDNSVIDGNIVQNNDVLNTESHNGIYVNNSDGNIISNNICLNNDKYEIEVSAGSKNNIVSGNNCTGTDHLGPIRDAGENTIVVDNQPPTTPYTFKDSSNNVLGILDENGHWKITGRYLHIT